MAASIRIVTVAYYPGTEFANMLRSIPAAATGLNYKVVCVDNTGRPDKSTAELCAECGYSYICRPDNPGYGAASNFGAVLEIGDSHEEDAGLSQRQPDCGGAAEEWLLLANPDLEFPPGSITALVKGAQKNPAAAIYGPALLGSDGQRYSTGRSFPYFSVGIGHAVFARIWPGNPWTKRYWGNAWQGYRTAVVDWVSGACLLIRYRDWCELGGYNPDYFMYFEDTDLGFRARQVLHKPSLLLAGVEVIHHQGTSSSRNPKSLRSHHESAVRFLRRLYPGLLWQPVICLMEAGLALRLRVMSK